MKGWLAFRFGWTKVDLDMDVWINLHGSGHQLKGGNWVQTQA